GGRDFRVRERRYAVFPQQPGKLTLGPVRFEAMVIPTRGFSRVQRYRSPEVEIEVLGAVPPPPSMPNAVWLPATSVRLSERWSDSGDLPVGEPRTRTLVIEADGVLDTQLPELRLAPVAGVRQYADQPELERDVTPLGLRARRTERYAVLAQAPGEIELPGVELPWFDVTQQSWQVARIAPQRLVVLPGAEPPAAPEPVPIEPAPVPPPATPDPGFWPLLSAVLAAGWLATAFGWWWTARAKRAAPRRRAARPATPAHVGERRLRKRLRAACDADDAAEARRRLLEWAAAKLGPDAPRSLGALAAVLPEDLGREVLALEAHLYGASGQPWSGAGLAEAVRALDSVTPPRPSRAADTLSPLYR